MAQIKSKIYRIDVNQPGVSELIEVLKAYDGTSVVNSRGKKTIVGITMKKTSPIGKRTGYLTKIQGFHLGDKVEKGDAIVARQSCAVTSK